MSESNRLILDYGTLPPHSRLKKCLRRLSLLLLIIASLYGCLLVWLYWGWRQEQPAMDMLARVGGRVLSSTKAGPALLNKFVPPPLAWIRERTTDVTLREKSATDKDVRTLQHLYRLEQLSLYGTQLTDAGLVHLKGLTALNILDLSGTRITDVGLISLKDMTGMRLLSLHGTQITNAGLVHLSGLTGLQGLLLSDTKITDAGLVHLKDLTGLQDLLLFDTQITDAGLVHLKHLTNLQWLNLVGTKVTQAGVADLQKALPHCRINWLPPEASPARQHQDE